MARDAAALLGSGEELLLTDIVLAECVYVLESFYEFDRDTVAAAMRAVLAFETITTVNDDLLLRAIGLYEHDRLDFAEAHLVASAESAGIGRIASFDKSIDRIATVDRVTRG